MSIRPDGQACALVGALESVRIICGANYPTAEAADNTLRYLSSTPATGSRIIFTYVDRAEREGTGQFSGYEEWRTSVRQVGEQWTFGFHRCELSV